MSENNVSQARLNANRENAQKSTGPVTQEGKEKVKLNAIKYGLTGNTLLFVHKDDMLRYGALVCDYETQFQPVGPEERALVQSIADTRWRLTRIPALELSTLATASAKLIENDPTWADPDRALALEVEVRRLHEKELRNLHLQESRLTRRREREMAELQQIQAARKAREAEALAEAAKATLLAKHNNQELRDLPGIGFDFSITRFEAYMRALTPAQKQKLLQTALATAGETLQTQEAAA